MKHSKRPWTKEEDDFLKENYGKLITKEIVKKLGRTRAAVAQRASKYLGLGGKALHLCGTGSGYVVSDEEILSKIEESGGLVCSTFANFGEKIGLGIGMTGRRLKILQLKGKVHITKLVLGGITGRTHTSFELFDGVSNISIIWTNENALIMFLKDKLSLSSRLPPGHRKSLTGYLKRALPRKTFLKVYKLYSRGDYKPV